MRGVDHGLDRFQVGDRVAFDADHGVALTVAGEPYLILEHDDVVVIVNESEAAA